MAGRLLPLTGGLLVLVVAACGSPAPGGPATAASSSTPVTPSASVTTASPSGSPSASGPSGASGASGSPRAATAQALPGEPYPQGPAAGKALAVVGVAAGATLALQDLPGPGHHAIRTLGPLAGTAVASGRSRLVDGADSTVWAEVTVDGTTGWADAAHLALPGRPADVTAEVLERLGRRPVAETMLDLGTAVAEVYVSTEPPSRVNVSVAPTVGTLGEITMDVVGLGDDSVAAQRLHIVATPGDESFTLKTVQGTPFCYRGVSAAGLCV